MGEETSGVTSFAMWMMGDTCCVFTFTSKIWPLSVLT